VEFAAYSLLLAVSALLAGSAAWIWLQSYPAHLRAELRDMEILITGAVQTVARLRGEWENTVEELSKLEEQTRKNRARITQENRRSQQIADPQQAEPGSEDHRAELRRQAGMIQCPAAIVALAVILAIVVAA
jgi:hypothetical protein